MKTYTDNIPLINDLLDQQLKSVIKKVAGLTLDSTPRHGIPSGDLWSYIITTKGDYCFTFMMCANSRVLSDIARNMNHGESVDKEVVNMYVSELFNILCGRIVSMINTTYHYSARFAVPRVVKGMYPTSADHYYYCDSGVIKMSLTDGTILTAQSI